MITKRILKRMHPKLRAYLLGLHSEGYTSEQGNTHIAIRNPDGVRVGTVSISPSDPRTQLNTLSDIRRTIKTL